MASNLLNKVFDQLGSKTQGQGQSQQSGQGGTGSILNTLSNVVSGSRQRQQYPNERYGNYGQPVNSVFDGQTVNSSNHGRGQAYNQHVTEGFAQGHGQYEPQDHGGYEQQGHGRYEQQGNRGYYEHQSHGEYEQQGHGRYEQQGHGGYYEQQSYGTHEQQGRGAYEQQGYSHHENRGNEQHEQYSPSHRR